MEELNSFSSNAKVGCPYFKKQTNLGICCSGIFHKQETTWLNFKTKKSKEEHLKNFCFDMCWRGCTIAAEIQNNESINDKEGKK